MSEHYKIGETVLVDTPKIVGQGTVVKVDAKPGGVWYLVKIFDVSEWHHEQYVNKKVDW